MFACLFFVPAVKNDDHSSRLPLSITCDSATETILSAVGFGASGCIVQLTGAGNNGYFAVLRTHQKRSVEIRNCIRYQQR